jgi:hypothetical protein
MKIFGILYPGKNDNHSLDSSPSSLLDKLLHRPFTAIRNATPAMLTAQSSEWQI